MVVKCVVRKFFFVVFLIFSLFLFTASSVSAATTIGMDDSSNWNIRIDGPGANENLPFGSIVKGDFDGDGAIDLAIDSYYSDFNGRANSGSVYIIFNTLLKQFSGTGNTLDLADSSNYNIRIDGSVNACVLGYEGAMQVVDMDNDGGSDLVLSCYYASFNSRTGSGSVYMIRDSLLSSYSGTGNNVDLLDTSNFNVRLDGEAAGDLFSFLSLNYADMTNDGKDDLIVGAMVKSTHSRTKNGSIYIIDNQTFSSLTGTGNLIDMLDPSSYRVRIDGSSNRTGTVLGYDYMGTGDFDADGKKDIAFGATAPSDSTNGSGSLYIITGDLLSGYLSSYDNVLDLIDPSSYNLRFDGDAHRTYEFGHWGPVETVDLNNNGKSDLTFPDLQASNNSIPESGSVYVWMDDFLDDYLSSTGNIVDLAQPNNYSLRFNGEYDGSGGLSSPEGGGWLGDLTLSVADLKNIGKYDLLIGGPLMSIDSNYQEGVIYAVSNDFINGFSGTGNDIEMSDSSSYYRQYYGAVGDHLVTELTLNPPTADLYGDNTNDLVLSAHYASNNGRTKSGSVYIIYNFPHSISVSSTIASDNNAVITGTVSAPDSTTSIAGVQYSLDSNSLLGTWTDCSGTSSFTCNIGDNAGDNHTVYIRAFDSNGTYTPQLNYANAFFNYITDSGPQACTFEKPEGIPQMTSVLSSSENSVTLTFNTVSKNVDSYVLEYGTEPGVYKFSAIGIPKDTNLYTVNYLQLGKIYYFRIRGNNGCSVGDWSNEVSGKTNSPPNVTNNLQIVNSKLEMIQTDEQSGQKEQVKKTETFPLKVFVADSDNNPIADAKVTIHSNVQTATTDNDGLAFFSEVEPGQHKILISYKNYSGEENVNLSPDETTKEFKLTITVDQKKQKPNLNYLLITSGIIFLLLFMFYKLKSKQGTR